MNVPSTALTDGSPDQLKLTDELQATLENLWKELDGLKADNGAAFEEACGNSCRKFNDINKDLDDDWLDNVDDNQSYHVNNPALIV